MPICQFGESEIDLSSWRVELRVTVASAPGKRFQLYVVSFTVMMLRIFPSEAMGFNQIMEIKASLDRNCNAMGRAFTAMPRLHHASSTTTDAALAAPLSWSPRSHFQAWIFLLPMLSSLQ